MRTIAFLLHATSKHQLSGGEKSLVELAAGLARRGVRCLLVAPGEGLSTAMARRAGLEVVVRKTPMLWLSHPLAMSLPGSLFRVALFLSGWPALFRLRNLFRSRHVGLVHVNGIVHVWGAAAARLAGLPLVWHVREIVGGRFRNPLLIRIAELLANRILAVSGAVARQFSPAGPGVRVVYNGIPGTGGGGSLPVPRGTGPVRVGHAGQILPQKGQEEFLEVARRLREAGLHGVEFRIAGSGPHGGRSEEDLRAAVDRLGLGEAVVLEGFLPDLPSFLRSLDVLAVTSTAPDPLPRVLAEAMMAGVPAVAFATGGIPEMIRPEETGILVPPGDLDGFAAALRRLIRDPELRRRMGMAARSRAVELYSMEAYIRHCADVYDEIGGGPEPAEEAVS